MGTHHKKKDGSNSNSSRTSPSKLEDTEFVRNGLLSSNSGDFDEGLQPSFFPFFLAGNWIDYFCTRALIYTKFTQLGYK
jgi:hypothetical protein